MVATILYLNTDPSAHIPQMTLAGMRRVASGKVEYVCEAEKGMEVESAVGDEFLVDYGRVYGIA